MFGENWAGRIDDVLDAIAGAGYEGVEISADMLREYRDQPKAFAEALRTRGLDLAGYFIDAPARAERDAGLATALRFVDRFPGAIIVLGAPRLMADTNPGDALECVAEFLDEVGRQGQRVGVPVAFHLDSAQGAIVQTSKHYERILDLTDPAVVHWVPDTGHISRSGADPLELVKRYRHRILHLHLRDVDANLDWRPIGHGEIDVRGVLDHLLATDFTGWVVAEEQSVEAWTAPDRLIVMDLQYIGRLAYG